MPKIFCQHCGGGTDYLNSRPNFCSSCGKSFGQIISKKRRVEPEPEYEEEEDDFSLGSINPLDHVEIELPKQSVGFTMDQITRSGPTAPLPEIKTSAAQGQSELQKLRDFVTSSRRNGRLRASEIEYRE